MKRVLSFSLLGLALLVGAAACGDLDNETTIKDLRVLAVSGEPAGFLVPLDDPGSITDTQATLTALVIDPKGRAGTLSVSGEACPDFIDTITTASGMNTKICPSAATINALPFPQPVRDLLATQPLPPFMEMPTAASALEYQPKVTFGLSPTQIAAFFNDPLAHPTGIPTIDLSTGFNREFGFDAIVNVDFRLGPELASVVKHVVYWPRLTEAQLPADLGLCTLPQVANLNPKIATLDLYAHRIEGDPVDPYAEQTPTLLRKVDELYVQPTYLPESAEHYLLRVRHPEQGLAAISTECRHELLTFKFYATAGTFSPPDRQSELLPIFTPVDGKVHLDSKYEPPTIDEMPADGIVTIWVVVRDERAGSSWSTRTIKLVGP